MAVKIINTTNDNNSTLKLEIDNGDLTKLNEAITKWKFKDYQSFMRFAVSIMLLNEDPSFSIKLNGIQQDIIPASTSLIEENGNIKND